MNSLQQKILTIFTMVVMLSSLNTTSTFYPVSTPSKMLDVLLNTNPSNIQHSAEPKVCLFLIYF